MLKDYIQLTKPGMVAGNLLPAMGAFLLASNRQVDWLMLFEMTFGLGLVIAAACAANNYLDRNIDSKMKRTQKRALVRGAVPPGKALIFSGLLLIAGSLMLALLTNWLALIASLIGYVGYVFVYGYFKRRSSLGTLVGTVPGAMPPVVGYAAAAGQLDWAAGLLFLILVFWQMPHFFAIAIFRRNDYAAAWLPVITVRHSVRRAKRQMIAYVGAFIIASVLLWGYGYAGYVYLVLMSALGTRWLLIGIRGLKAADDNGWGRQMFGFSLIVLLIFSAVISLNAWLP